MTKHFISTDNVPDYVVKLERRARLSAKKLGHRMLSFIHSTTNNKSGRMTYESDCSKCGNFIELVYKPRYNELEINGPATALDCDNSLKR